MYLCNICNYSFIYPIFYNYHLKLYILNLNYNLFPNYTISSITSSLKDFLRPYQKIIIIIIQLYIKI